MTVLETIFPANIQANAKQSAFSTSHLTDSNEIKHKYN